MADIEVEGRKCPNPSCEFDKHHPKANFCILCGTLLYRRCDNCIEVNPRYARFCQYCGTNLEEVRETASPQPRTTLYQEPVEEKTEDKEVEGEKKEES